MFKKKQKDKEKNNKLQEEKEIDKTVLDEILPVIKKAKESGSFMICMSHIYEDENKEERLEHNVFTVGFKKDDIPVSLNAYTKQVNNQIKGGDKSPVEDNK